ncbi:bifunctional homocysteine S-methyltransferase/methylenetetrahydrofolate reductase [candidate division KSB1 bacterium]
MSKKIEFKSKIKENKVLVIDGAMGTYLFSKGMSMDKSFDYLNLTYPEVVEELHLEYIAAGAEIIETNTYSANRFKLETYGLEDKVCEINKKAVQIAKNAAGKSDIYIAGSIGPVGKPFKPSSSAYIDKIVEAYLEQASCLLDGGVDLLIIETFSDLKEMDSVISAIKKLDSNIPLILSRTFFEDGRTLMSEHPRDVAKKMDSLGVDIIGANCTVGPQRMVEIIKRMSSVSEKKLIAMPTAGLPQLERGKLVYQSKPEYLASYAERLVESGAFIIGGCCGTTPAHIKAIAEVVKDKKYIKPSEIPVIDEEIETAIEIDEDYEDEGSDFGKKVGKKFVYTVELDIPRGLNLKKVIEGAEYLKKNNIDAVNISDGARARLRMSPIVVAYEVLRKTGMESILHFTCRDRNLLGLQSEILGAYTLNLKNILAITGDPTNIGDYPNATSVFDVDSVGLVKIVDQLNKGLDLAGNSIGRPTRFTITVAANPNAADDNYEFERLHKKIDAGAQVVFTQPVFELEKFDLFLNKVKRFRIPIIVGILPLRSFRHAEFLHNEVPGIEIPANIRNKMKNSGTESWRTGVEIATEFLSQVSDMAAGAYIMPPFEKYEMAVMIIENAGG